MEEEQIRGKVLITDVQRNFGTDEAEVAAQLDEELAQAVEETAMQILLRVCLGQPQERGRRRALRDGFVSSLLTLLAGSGRFFQRAPL